ncbi:MAG: helix-turn-helix domain-containing protein [Propionibacteriaceae bacterium]|jgi:excisionase family DNA binding protein|nr:helix-turn-helix domain-containing protein [Propionibacteriaceae bacterium]
MITFTISPDTVRAEPLPDRPDLPTWARDALSFVVKAGQAGETVSLEARLETMTPAEMADRLGISRPTVSRRIAEGSIRSVKIGNRHRIPVAEFERYRSQLLQDMADHYMDDIEADLLA